MSPSDGAATTDRDESRNRTIVDRSRGDGGPVFAEPWQAQTFALVVALHERGVFSWDEWSAALSIALDEQDADAAGGDDYRCWLVAVEGLLAEHALVAAEELDGTAAAWHRAAQATPHGMPILLENDPGPPD